MSVVTRRARSRSARFCGGFTLLELLFAVAVTGIISVAAFMSIDAAYTVKRQAEKALDDAQAGRIALDIIARDLEAVAPPSGIIIGEINGTDARAGNRDADVLAYTTTSRQMLPTDAVNDLQRVRLYLATDPAADLDPRVTAGRREPGQMLVRAVTTNALARVTPAPTVQVLARGVTGLSVRYYDGLGWETRWDSGDRNNQPPAAFEVKVTFAATLDERGRPRDDARTVSRIVRPLVADDPAAGALILGF